jgi:hypothetical protein
MEEDIRRAISKFSTKRDLRNDATHGLQPVGEPDLDNKDLGASLLDSLEALWKCLLENGEKRWFSESNEIIEFARDLLTKENWYYSLCVSPLTWEAIEIVIENSQRK